MRGLIGAVAAISLLTSAAAAWGDATPTNATWDESAAKWKDVRAVTGSSFWLAGCAEPKATWKPPTGQDVDVSCKRKGSEQWECDPEGSPKGGTISISCRGVVETLQTEVGGDPAASAGADAGALGTVSPSVWRQALRELGLPLAGRPFGHYYDAAHNRAVLFVNANAEPLFPMLDQVDENDDVTVVIVGTSSALDARRISFDGCERPLTDARVLRGDLPTPKGKDEVRQDVRAIYASLGKCRAGDSGGPRLLLRDATQGNLATLTIPVNPLYRFVVGAAAAYDATQVHEIGLQTPPGDTIARITESEHRLGLSSLIYVGVYPWARDFHKTDFFLLQRTQIFVGLDPRAFDSFLVAGVGYEIVKGGSLLLGGRWIAREQRLATGSGLSAGSRFDGSESSIPTEDRWKVGSVFIGAGLSQHLITELFK